MFEKVELSLSGLYNLSVQFVVKWKGVHINFTIVNEAFGTRNFSVGSIKT